MKKITAFLMALVLISSFAFVVSAEGDPVNYAASGTYVITPGNETGFLSSTDGTKYYGDDDCTILTDGVNPYYTIEEPGLGIHLDDEIINKYPYKPGTEQRFKVESV